MAYSESWLTNNEVRRCILAVINRYNVLTTSEETIYLSTVEYATADSAVAFLPVISGGLQFTEAMSTTGGISTSYGDIEINNANGEYDSWLDSTKYIWVNRNIALYYGDPTWSTPDIGSLSSTFQLIFNGLIEDVGSRARERLNIKVRDKMERLNYPLTEDKLGTFGTWGASAQPNIDATKPLAFGEVHNVTPLQVDPSTLQYQICASNAELLLEIRDNGVPVHTSGTLTGATITDSTPTIGGTTFKLNAPLVGVCTVSLQGVKQSINLATGALVSGTYVNKIANLIALITTQFGDSNMKLTGSTELDLTNLSAFEASNTQPVGIWVSDNSSVLTVCQALASSISAQIYFTRLGKLQILQLGIPTSDPIINITDSDILHHSLYVAGRTEVQASSKLGYCKNWTIQNGLETGIPQSHKDMFSEEYLTFTSTADSTVKTLYRITSDPIQKNTMLITTADATVEANRLRDYYKVPHTIYSFVGTPRMQLLKLGQAITLTHSRFGLSSGPSGQVISLNPNWSTGQVTVGVII